MTVAENQSSVATVPAIVVPVLTWSNVLKEKYFVSLAIP